MITRIKLILTLIALCGITTAYAEGYGSCVDTWNHSSAAQSCYNENGDLGTKILNYNNGWKACYIVTWCKNSSHDNTYTFQRVYAQTWMLYDNIDGILTPHYTDKKGVMTFEEKDTGYHLCEIAGRRAGFYFTKKACDNWGD